ncbi:MAG: RNA polymerase sigma factor [Planctomycetes bacterium]|nr:RNA polymerase sigma factor [Planctomycetota bacterium]
MSRSEASENILQLIRPLQEPAEEPDAPSLIARVLKGDREAFRPLVETYEPAVFGLCRRLLGCRGADAEDVAQETFLRAFERLGELKDRRRFAPWLYQIARSLCRDWTRRSAVERRALEEKRKEIERRMAGGACEGDGGCEVDPLLGTLPLDERRALVLKYFEGLPYREIARRMDLSFSRVDHLIRQARSRLSHRLSVRRRWIEGDL